VINVLKAWIDKHYEDFEADEQLEQTLVEFLTCNKTHHYYQQNSALFSSFLLLSPSKINAHSLIFRSAFTQATNQLKKLYDKKVFFFSWASPTLKLRF